MIWILTNTAYNRRMGVTAFVMEVVFSVSDTNVFAIVLALVALVHNCRHSRVIKPGIENDRFRALAHLVAQLTEIRLALILFQ